MNGRNNSNDNGADRRIVEADTTEMVDTTGKNRTNNETGCDCGGKGGSCAITPHDEPQGDGRDVRGPTDIGGDENARERAAVVNEIRNIADGIENGTLQLIEGRGGKYMRPGRGKKAPEWTGAYMLGLVYK